ncbi:MAG: CDP-diacylglycerol--serine O-phosphatidyltransferase, partial [Nitratireductor sp.]
GLTAIRYGFEGKMDFAVAAVILAAFLDGIDGRVARFLKSTSRFGAEMDSLADFLNFGVTPAILLYFSYLHNIQPVGWIAVLIFSICACLRLARFNVQLDNPNQPKWKQNFFIGVPAPAGAIVAMLPIYMQLLGLPQNDYTDIGVALFLVCIGLLLVSNLPTYSGKSLGAAIPRNIVLPLIIALIILLSVLFSYPWQTLIAISILYLAAIPIGLKYYKMSEKKALESEANKAKPKKSRSTKRAASKKS